MRSPILAVSVALLCWGAPAAGGAEEGSPPVVRSELRPLSSDEVDRYISAFRELKKLGLDASAQLEGGASQARQRAAAMKFGGEMQKVIARHDFEPQSFTDVHWNVLMAYLAGAMSAQQEQLDAARAQQEQMLAQMKQQMPAEQYEAAAKAMAGMLPVLSAATAVPEANRALVAARKSQLDALFENEDAARD